MNKQTQYHDHPILATMLIEPTTVVDDEGKVSLTYSTFKGTDFSFCVSEVHWLGSLSMHRIILSHLQTGSDLVAIEHFAALRQRLLDSKRFKKISLQWKLPVEKSVKNGGLTIWAMEVDRIPKKVRFGDVPPYTRMYIGGVAAVKLDRKLFPNWEPGGSVTVFEDTEGSTLTGWCYDTDEVTVYDVDFPDNSVPTDI